MQFVTEALLAAKRADQVEIIIVPISWELALTFVEAIPISNGMKTVWRDSAGIPPEAHERFGATAVAYTKTLAAARDDAAYSAPESSLRLPFDDTLYAGVTDAVSALGTASLRHVVVVGIGGSSLGTRALYDALGGYTDALQRDRYPHCVFVETIDELWLQTLKAQLLSASSEDEWALIIVSKSGSTTETVASAAVLYQALRERFSDAPSRTVVITDEASPLHEFADREGIRSLHIPATVGGRYSVFSPVGLLPLLLLRTDTAALREGARAATIAATDGSDALAWETAAVLAHLMQEGYRVHDLFLFAPRLESLGKWYRQLLAESIGKEKREGEHVVRVGLTPTVSIGTTDLHSVAQLHFGGPRDTVTTFVHAAPDSSESLRAGGALAALLPALSRHALGDVLDATFQGVREAYRAHALPFMSCELEGVTARELGYFMQFFMLQTMYLGHFAGINAFDQPAVEIYKEKTRALLSA